MKPPYGGDYGLENRVGYRHLAQTAMLYAPIIVLSPSSIEIGPYSRIDSFVKLEGGMKLEIGKYVHISSFAHLNIGGGWVTIGDFVSIASGARVFGGSNMKQGVSMSSAAPQELQIVERAQTMISDFAFVGAGATVMPGVRVGIAAILGAGAVATHDLPARTIWAGVPARLIGQRPMQKEWNLRYEDE